jgi:translation elongation factor EF-Tu-like GTPase
MEIGSLMRLKASLKRMLETLEKIDEVNDKEMQETVEDWVRRSELAVHQLNLRKLEIRREEALRQK